MRIRRISLEWFRGAAHDISLDSRGKSAVIYGPNGAGKSCFVDALEYAIAKGRIGHLAHEYSGKHQEKAVLNTHRPDDCEGVIRIHFGDASELVIRIAASGGHSMSGDGERHLASLDVRRTILRQDEVSEFVHSTKGQKYSVLLPLLGLGHLETQAENFRQLAITVARQAAIREASAGLAAAEAQAARIFGTPRPDTAAQALIAMCESLVAAPHEHSADDCAVLLEAEIDRRLRDGSSLDRQQAAVEQMALIDVRSARREVRAAAEAVADMGDPVLSNKLDVLRAAKRFLDAGPDEAGFRCPACGTTLEVDAMRDHVDREMSLLEEALEKATVLRATVAALTQLVERVKHLCSSPEVQSWAATNSDERVLDAVGAAAAVHLTQDPEGTAQLDAAAEVASAAVVAAGSSVFQPTAATELARAKEKLLIARGWVDAERASESARSAEVLVEHLGAQEDAIRDDIQSQSREVITEISADIQRMWGILHPGEPIEDVRLHIPGDADKAIDIALKFHGKDLESPRLTLSEGYRNSLGLCVFLAMALREQQEDHPIVLDDVIVSLDRGHRGMVVRLLQAEFPDRQILVFTHDREWFADLRQQLDQSKWSFLSLRPFEHPTLGIRWSERTGSVGDARVHLDSRPDVAANDVRKAMDVEMAFHADRLGVLMPFARGERNDRRMAHDFLSALLSNRGRAFQRKAEDGSYTTNDAGILALREADQLLLTWANRGSHTEDVTRSEAELLITTCERAIDALRCDACAKFVNFAETTSGTQCQCGGLRWKS